MKEREELELILNLLRKYNLPLSPILEYAIKEKMEEFPMSDSVDNEEEPITPNLSDETDEEQSKQLEIIGEQYSSSIEAQEDNDFEVEHVYLDSRGKIIKKMTSSQLIVSPKKEEVKDSNRGKAWTENEEELVILKFQQGNDIATIAELVGRTELAIKARLAKLGLIDYTYGQEDGTNLASMQKELSKDTNSRVERLSIINTTNRCFLVNILGQKVYSSSGKLIELEDSYYRTCYAYSYFSINIIDRFHDGTFETGERIVYARSRSELYLALKERSYTKQIEELKECEDKTFKVKVSSVWYNNNGSRLDNKNNEAEGNSNRCIGGNSNEDARFSHNADSVMIGKRIRLLPSQEIGVVVRTRTDNKGNEKLVVKTDKEQLVEIYNNPYIYEILKPVREEKVKETKVFDSSISKRTTVSSVSSVRGSKATLGNWIIWKPTGIIGKVVRFIRIGSLNKIVLQLKDGKETEVYDNPKAYEILKQ